jgi:hypothetical protein
MAQYRLILTHNRQNTNVITTKVIDRMGLFLDKPKGLSAGGGPSLVISYRS